MSRAHAHAQVLYPEAGQEHRPHWLRHQQVRWHRQCSAHLPLLASLIDSMQVAGEAQGSDDALNQFVQHLNQGPSAASVKSVEQSDIATKSGESGFSVQ
jgi:hypothetical protein